MASPNDPVPPFSSKELPFTSKGTHAKVNRINEKVNAVSPVLGEGTLISTQSEHGTVISSRAGMDYIPQQHYNGVITAVGSSAKYTVKMVGFYSKTAPPTTADDDFSTFDFTVGTTSFTVTNRFEIFTDSMGAKTYTNTLPVGQEVMCILELSYYNLSGGSDHPVDIWVMYHTPPILFPVTLSTDGGANATNSGTGTPWIAATYTYTCIFEGNNVLTTALPTWTRPRGLLSGPATHGMCSRSGGNITLLFTDERLAIDNICSP